MSSQDHQQGESNNEFSVLRDYSGCACRHARAVPLTVRRYGHAPADLGYSPSAGIYQPWHLGMVTVSLLCRDLERSEEQKMSTGQRMSCTWEGPPYWPERRGLWVVGEPLCAQDPSMIYMSMEYTVELLEPIFTEQGLGNFCHEI